MKKIILLISIFSGFLTGSHAQDAADPVNWTFSMKRISAQDYDLILAASIRTPYHIYSQFTDPGLGKPTHISFQLKAGMALIGSAKESGEIVKERFRDDSIAFYERSVSFIQRLHLDSGSLDNIRGSINYMICTRTNCLPEFTRRFTISKDRYAEAPPAREIAKSNSSKVNSPAKNIRMKTINSAIISLSSVYKKNKLTLVDFWASWCVPCRREAKFLLKYYPQVHKKGFEVFAISMDTKKESWEKAVHQDGYPWIQVSDLKGMASDVAKVYSVKVIPRSFLVDSNGKILASDLQGNELKRFISDFISKH